MFKSYIKNEKFWFTAIIIFFLLIRFALFFYDFSAPTLAHSSFRENQNLMVARNFYLNGINVFLPQLDMFGDPGYCVLEFPIYQAMITVLYKIFFPSVIFGRLLNIMFTILSALFLYLIAKKLFDERIAIFSILFFLFSPLILFYSRTVMLEPMEIFLFLAAMYLYFKWIDTEKFYLLTTGTFLSLTFILVKPLYIVIFLPVVFIHAFNKENGAKRFGPSLILSFSIQAIFLLLWLLHSRIINNLFPNNFAFTAKHLYTWYLGTIKQHFNLNIYFIILARIMGDMVGKAGIVFFLVSLWYWRKIPTAIKAWLFSSIIYIIIFINLNYRHDYYQLLMVPLLAILMSIGFQRILTLIDKRKNLFIFLLIFILAYANADTAKRLFEIDNVRQERIKIIREYVPPHSKAIYIGLNLDKNLPHYHYFVETKGYNVNLSQERISKENIIKWNKKDDIEYFIYMGKHPKNIYDIFKNLGGDQIFYSPGEILIYKL